MSPPRQRPWFVESSPRNILADSGPLFALIHAGDPDHARAIQFAGSYAGLLTTTWPVVTEVAYLLAKYAGRGVDRLLGMVLDAEDASLVAVGERLGVLDVITLDRRDFSRYRTRARQAFTNHFPPRN